MLAESLYALDELAHNPGAILVSFRQLISRHPQSTALAVLAARMLADVEPIAAGQSFLTELDDDQSGRFAEELFGEETASGVSETAEIIDSIASSRDELFLAPGRTEWIREARAAGRRVIVVTAVGSRLPPRTWNAYLARNSSLFTEPAPCELVPTTDVDRLIGPTGLTPTTEWVSDCQDVAEIVSF